MKGAKIAVVLLALLAALWLSDRAGLSPDQAVTGYATMAQPEEVGIALYRGTNYVGVMPGMIGKKGSEIAKSSGCGSFDYITAFDQGESYASKEIPQSMVGKVIRIDIPTKRKGGVFGLFGSWDYSIKCYYKEPQKEYEQPPIKITDGSVIAVTPALTGKPLREIFKDYGCDLNTADIYYRNSEDKNPYKSSSFSYVVPGDRSVYSVSDLSLAILNERVIGMAMLVDIENQCTLYGEPVQAPPAQPPPTPVPTQPGTTGTQPDTTTPAPPTSTPTPTPTPPTSTPTPPSPTPPSTTQPRASPECVDSDNGKDYYRDGVVTISIGLLPDKCSSKNSRLVEYFCNAKGEADFEAVACQYGCSSSGKSCEPPALPFIGGRKSVIAISEDMAGKQVDKGIFDQCDVEFAQYYDATKSDLPVEDRWDVLYAKKGPFPSKTLTEGMVGHGLIIVLEAPYTSCRLKTKGYTDSLGAAASLIKGSNLIAVPKSMTANAKSFNDVKGDCAIESVQLYDKSQDKDVELTAAFKFGQGHLGKAAWVKATNRCTLDDPEKQKEEKKKPAAGAECSDTEGDGVKDPYKEGAVTTSTKDGAVITNTESLYDTCFFDSSLLIEYFCNAENKADFEAVECLNGCSSSGKSCEPQKRRVNLVPELMISPKEGVKSGDNIEVALYIKNTGSEAATPLGIKRRSTATLSNAVYFYKDKEYGQEAISPIYATLDFLSLKDKAIQPGEAGKVLLAKQTVKIPEDFSGDLVIAAVVDAQLMYLEADETDNRQSLSIPLTEKAAGPPPNLVPTAVEVFPAIEKFPAEILSAFITVENKGEIAAVAEKQFLENKISILQGDVEVCKDSRSDHVTINPGKSHEFRLTPKLVNGFGAACVLDDEKANYRAVVEVDTLQTSPAGAKGVVTESNENDNKQTFQIKGPQACSSLGARDAGRYCSIEAETLLTWLAQKAAAQPCSHNFECSLELCVKSKCVTEAQKEQILKIVS